MHAVIERGQVLRMTPQAQQRGVRLGMRRAGVLAMAPGAAIHERAPALEQEALQEVALALLQYTPQVALHDGAGVLLDITASLKAFRGHLALCRRVRASVLGLGFSVRLGMAPTAQGAWLLACQPGARAMRRVIGLQRLALRLDRLPCGLLPAAAPHRDWLDGIGCRWLADLRRLPRAALQRRTGRALLDALDRAYGLAPELFDWVQPPLTFAARIELPDRVEQAGAVLFAARRLLLQMAGWLTAQQRAVAQFILFLEHERGRAAVPPTPVEVALAEPVWQEEHLLSLLKEKLGRMTLTAPVIALRLEALQLHAMLPPTASLFVQPGGAPGDYRRLLDLLGARLGAHNVLAPAPVADHRPEAANQWLPAAMFRRAPAPDCDAERPFWLLEQPVALLVRDHRPFYGSPLQLLRGPERIECGWWDSDCAMRDYFIAQDDDGACYWIYRERGDEQANWFLHGLFG